MSLDLAAPAGAHDLHLLRPSIHTTRWSEQSPGRARKLRLHSSMPAYRAQAKPYHLRGDSLTVGQWWLECRHAYMDEITPTCTNVRAGLGRRTWSPRAVDALAGVSCTQS